MKLSEQNQTRIRKQYQLLAEVGIGLNPHYDVDDLVRVIEHLGRFDMKAMLAGLGDAYGKLPYFHLSDNVWLFDTECVEDPQAYADIAYRLSALTVPELPIDHVSSDLDFEAQTAWLEFNLNGETFHWDLTVEDDWVDPRVFDHFCRLLATVNPKKALAVSEDGQASFFVYTDADTLDKIARVTEMPWKWLLTAPTR